jgi:hypothetical protein
VSAQLIGNWASIFQNMCLLGNELVNEVRLVALMCWIDADSDSNPDKQKEFLLMKVEGST